MPTEPRRVACVGGSITFGLGLKNRREDCYPAVLQNMLGDGFRVRNFGYSGAAVSRESTEPYWKTPSFVSVNRFEPETVLLALGTNDAQVANAPALPQFKSDYLALIKHFQSADARVVVITPPPVFLPHLFEGPSEIDVETLDSVVRPAVIAIAQQEGLPMIDAYGPLLQRQELFPDHLHPNAEGARLLAEWAASSIRAWAAN